MKKLFSCLLAISCGSLHAYTRIVSNQPAEIVIGQTTFSANIQGTNASGLNHPRGIAIDPTTGKVFVADSQNNRVLRFSSPAALTSGVAAERVIGQPNLTTTTGNPATQETLLNPMGLAFDGFGRLYVADTGHNRVLRFDAPSAAATDGISANRVFGQSGFFTSTTAISLTGMNRPTAVAVQPLGGILWVADSGNNRVSLFMNPERGANGPNLTRVFGQVDYNSKVVLNPPTASSLNSPEGLAIGADKILWVADTGNHRILRYDAVGLNSPHGRPADFVLGQANFTSGDAPSTATASTIYAPQGLALDTSGAMTSLWVTDRVHNRVLRFDNANGTITNGANASVVLGQASFAGGSSSTSQNGFDFPHGVALDNSVTSASPRTVWVADTNNNRLLRFNPHLPAPPSIAGGTSYKTKKKKGTIGGSASAEAGVAHVEFKGPKGGFALANFAGGWSFSSKFKVGVNRFTVIAYDTIGQASSPLTIVVKRMKPKK